MFLWQATDSVHSEETFSTAV